MINDYNQLEKEKFNAIVDKFMNRKSTEELSCYDDFKVKAELFEANICFTKASDFSNFIDSINSINSIKNERPLIFRGVGKASYRLFNKAQRNFRANQLGDFKNESVFHNSIQTMLENAKEAEQNILLEYFNSFGVKENDVAILSLLQHYGAPTPLLDWTYDIYVAIFFALNDLKNTEYKEDTNEIDDFFSIYFMREDMPQYMLNNYKPLSIYTKSKATYNTLKKRKVAHICEIYKNGKPKLFLQNNLRILRQKGIFIYNNSSYLPLEEIFLQHSFLYYAFRSPQDDLVPKSPIFCLNIHKSLAPALKREINKMGYKRASMFLDAKDLALQAVPNTLYEP